MKISLLISILFIAFLGVSQERDLRLDVRVSYGEVKIEYSSDGIYSLDLSKRVFIPFKKGGTLYRKDFLKLGLVYFVETKQHKRKLKNTVYLFNVEGKLLKQFSFKGSVELVLTKKEKSLFNRKESTSLCFLHLSGEYGKVKVLSLIHI